MSKKVLSKQQYNLSDGSKTATFEFTEANKTVSLFYQRFKQITGQSWPRERLDAFRKRIIQIIRSGPDALNGRRRLWDGNFSQLSGYELNPKASVANLFAVNIIPTIVPLQHVTFKIPPLSTSRHSIITKTQPVPN